MNISIFLRPISCLPSTAPMARPPLLPPLHPLPARRNSRRFVCPSIAPPCVPLPALAPQSPSPPAPHPHNRDFLRSSHHGVAPPSTAATSTSRASKLSPLHISSHRTHMRSLAGPCPYIFISAGTTSPCPHFPLFSQHGAPPLLQPLHPLPAHRNSKRFAYPSTYPHASPRRLSKTLATRGRSQKTLRVSHPTLQGTNATTTTTSAAPGLCQTKPSPEVVSMTRDFTSRQKNPPDPRSSPNDAASRHLTLQGTTATTVTISTAPGL